MKHLTWILAAGAALATAGCGQKGPLYLPDKNASVITRPAAPQGQTPPAPTGAPQPAPQGQTPQAPTGTPQPAPPGQTPPAPTPPKQPQDKDDGSQQPK
jgi:predicted small lipoprotein YifL